MELRRVLAVLDRLVHPSTHGTDQEQSIEALRRLFHGQLPTELLNEVASVQDIAALNAQLAELEGEKVLSERSNQREITQLKRKIAALQRKVEGQIDDLQPSDDGYYTCLQVNAIILLKFGKDHGVKKALVEKNQRERQCNPELPKITDGLWQRWRKENRYPAWAIAQVKAMSRDDLPGKKQPWTTEEKAYLYGIYSENPLLTNQQLADLCSQRFGRHITDCSIRGALTRARNARLLTYRPR